jgi:DNA-binding winged helix-turn-helix (wHTH) protein/predicted Zn-dependent protease
MSPEPELAQVVRFGAFELDLQASELRKQGLRIRIQQQPLRVLAVLLQNPGALVTRERLRAEVWPTGTFVDFDNSLNTAVNKLREVLGDSSDNPRFIETLPRLGYRFIAPVTGDQKSESGGKRFPAPAARRTKVLGSVALALLAGLAAGGFVWHRLQPKGLTEKDTIVLGEFANQSGDRLFDGTLRQGLLVQLEQSPFLRLVPEEQVQQTLRMMGRDASAQLTPDIAREICKRTNSTAVLGGSIAQFGTRYNLVLRAADCQDDELLASTTEIAKDKSDVFNAVDNLASRMRSKLGESLKSIQRYNTPLEQATTPSLEALQFYTLGIATLMDTGNFAASILFFQRAIERDPNFAMAYWAMGDAYAALGESAASATAIKKAFDLRGGVNELERLLIESDYECYVTGDLVKARRSLELNAKMYPRDNYPPTILADIANMLGQYDIGLQDHLRAFHLYPSNSIAYRNVTFNYLLLNRIEDAAATAREARAHGLDGSLGPILYGIAFYRGDANGMQQQVSNAAGKPGQEHLLWVLESDTAAYFGHLNKARELSRRAADLAAQAGEQETVAQYYAAAALRDALFGNARYARIQAATARRGSSGRDIEYGVALALTYAGEAARAQTLTENLSKQFPDDTVVRFNYLPTLRARLALLQSNPQQAVTALETAMLYELGMPSWSYYNWPNLYPVYARGEAYLATHRGLEAATEFQKIIDHRSIVLNEPIAALAHLQLARAYEIAGQTSKAREAYQQFLTLWREADPDIPILKQAKAEYAKLQ